MTDEPNEEMVTVTLINIPVALADRTRKNYEAMQREFALIHYSDDETRESLPVRLQQVVERTHNEMASSEIPDQGEIRAAVAAGAQQVTMELKIRRSASAALAELQALLGEADDFAREGELITVALSPECRAFREWFLGECVRQVAGEPPRAWTGQLE
jgi:hypothetical protein